MRFLCGNYYFTNAKNNESAKFLAEFSRLGCVFYLFVRVFGGTYKHNNASWGRSVGACAFLRHLIIRRAYSLFLAKFDYGQSGSFSQGTLLPKIDSILLPIGKKGIVMGKFFKTAAVCFAMCAGVFAQNVGVDLSVEESATAQRKYEHFNKMKNVGNGLIIGGAAFGTLGLVMGMTHTLKAAEYDGFYDVSTQAGLDKYNDAKEKQDAELSKAIAWLIVEYVGYSAMTAGIPIRIVGRVKANQWKSKIPTAYIVPNGAKLVWNF